VSCYIPAFTEHNGPKRRAACGAWISRQEHSAEPTCATCQAWLAKDAEQSDDPDVVFGPPPASFPPIDRRPEMTTGYAPKRRVR